MPLILHHKDPARIIKHDIYEVEAGTNLLDWLCEQWQSSDEMSDGLSVTVLLNGKPIFESDNENANEGVLDFTIGELDTVSIVNRPAVEAVIIAVVAIVVAVAVSLALAPSLPGDAGSQSESPNNRLQSAQNSFRPGEARPEIFGKVVSYPDFIQPSYFEYVNDLKIVYELGYIGEGFFDIGEVRNGATQFNTIPGSSFQIFEPGEAIPQGLLTINRTADPVDGQVLIAPDDESLEQDRQIDSYVSDGVSNTELTLVEGSTFTLDTELEIGDYLTLSALSGGTLVPFTAQVQNLAVVSERTVITLDSLEVITEIAQGIVLAVTDEDGNRDNYVGYFEIPGNEAEEVWFNWQMPQGLRTESGKQLSIDLEFEIEAIDANDQPTGLIFVKNVTVTDNTLNPLFRTTKFTPAEFPAMIISQYRARVRRLTEQADGAASQQIKMEQFVSVTPYTNLDNSKGTIISWQRRATTFAISTSGNKNNMDVTRRLPTYNRATGVYDVNNLTATRDFADAAAYELIVAAGRDASTVDLAELYAINDGLLHPELGYFDFTFDNKNVGLGERIESICNAARVNPFRDGAVWRFTRDEIKPIRTAMFNRRVTVGNSSKQSWLLQRPDDKDSVALTYVDPDDNVERILYRRIDDSGNIVDDGQGRQALEINLAGCRNFFQAWNRINLEMRRIIYQRRTVNDTTLRDGMIVGLLERVGWVDPNDVTLSSGEILGFSGDVYDTSERFEPVSGQSYVVYITDDQGNTSNSVAVTARTDTEFGFIASGLSGAYLASPSGDQLGSRYFIGTASDLTATDFLVTSRKPQADGSVAIELVEYIPQMYELDNANPPQESLTMPVDIASTAVSNEGEDAVANITVKSDGTITASGGFTADYVPTPATGIGSNFEAMLTQESGNAIGGSAVGVWIPLSSDVEWTLTESGDPTGTASAIASVEVREISFTENVGLSSLVMSAVVGGVVELPATISVSSNSVGASARSSVQFFSNGTWRGVGDFSTSGNYVSSASGIGELYEARATKVSGTTTTGSPLDVWINLGGSAVSWDLVVPGGGFISRTGVIDVEIREVANVSNIDTSQVTLIARTEL
ncbi:coil containing protein [Vibrio phage 1.076.O._10N.286.51.B7]|nr:coil containing protein [Vibrio phage 1.076.O._10N.286.51.B7]